MSTNISEDSPQHEDLLWGAQAIADFLGVPVDRIYYLIRTRKLPVGKLGRRMVVASRKKLLRAIDTTLT